MSSRIETLLNEILNAVYGEEVRGAIHDAIEECYDDVSTAKTTAEDATSAANAAASNAESKATLANTAAGTANTAATNANTKAELADAATSAASVATAGATSAANAASLAATSANSAASAANTATSDASTAATTALSAANSATSAATSANSAADSATRAASSASTAATSATTAASSASTAATAATSAASAANAAAALANTKAELADSAADDATDAAIAANTAANNSAAATTAAIAAAASATSAASSATTAMSAANNAASAANIAAGSANTAATAATTATDDCTAVIYSATTATNAATTATTRAVTAAQAIEGMTVTSETLPPGSTAYASITDVSGHKNIQFGLVKGDTGPAFLIKGDAYATVEDLMEDVTDPEIGDMYNVGASAPYELYRWTGTVWEDQGAIGVSFTAIDSTDIDTMWNGSSIGGSERKWLNDTGMLYFIVQKIQAALSGKVDTVSGKGLSTNDLTDALVTTIVGHTDSISALSSIKVDKVSGMGLSSNDFTSALLTKLNGIETGATATVIDTALSTSSTNPVRNSVISTKVNNIDTDIGTVEHNLAAEYSNSATYAVGDYCVRNHLLYRCTTAIIYAETWNSSHWTQVYASAEPFGLTYVGMI